MECSRFGVEVEGLGVGGYCLAYVWGRFPFLSRRYSAAPSLTCHPHGSGCRVWGAGCRVSGVRCRIEDVGCRVQGADQAFDHGEIADAAGLVHGGALLLSVRLIQQHLCVWGLGVTSTYFFGVKSIYCRRSVYLLSKIGPCIFVVLLENSTWHASCMAVRCSFPSAWFSSISASGVWG